MVVRQLKFGKIKIYILKLYYILIIKTTMRKYILTSILGLLTFLGFGQYTVFSENIGTTSTPATISISTNIFQNSFLTFSGSADTRLTTPSIVTGPPIVPQYVGASGSRNVFITNTIGSDFQISNISTVGYFNLNLSFGSSI